MALTQSSMMDLGAKAPPFSLPDTEGAHQSLEQCAGTKGLLVVFMCNHCPYVIHIAPALAALAREYAELGIACVGINSNDVHSYPQDSPPRMREEKQRRGYDFPYLFDESQAVAHAYGAACTPDLYLFDGAQTLVYRGQFDDTRPHRIASGNYDSARTPATGASLRAAMDALLRGDPPLDPQQPSMGCNIKWRPGNEPHS